MKKMKVLLLSLFLIVTLFSATACGRYGRLFIKSDIAKLQAIFQEDKTSDDDKQDEIIIY